MIVPLTVLYIIPTILSIVVIFNKQNEVTRGEFIEIVIVSLVPLVNIIIGCLGGLLALWESKTVTDFLNKRIK